MEAAGHPPIARIHSFGQDGDGAAAYYDTADALGFLVEAVDPPAACRQRTSRSSHVCARHAPPAEPVSAPR
jgi:hypothetical protein